VRYFSYIGGVANAFCEAFATVYHALAGDMLCDGEVNDLNRPRRGKVQSFLKKRDA